MKIPEICGGHRDCTLIPKFTRGKEIVWKERVAVLEGRGGGAVDHST